MTNLPNTIASPMVMQLYGEIESIVGKRRLKFGGTIAQTSEQPRSYHRSWDDSPHEPGYSTQYWGDRHRLGKVSRFSCALDLTFVEPDDIAMFTARLHHLAISEGPLNWKYGLREFAGTLDNVHTYGYDTTRNAQTYGWDFSHLYHIHLSFNRRLVTSKNMLRLVKIFH